MKKVTMTGAFATMFIISSHGQGFLNLNFESAQNPPGNPGNGELVPVVNALPDWAAYDGSLALSDIYYVSNVIYGTAASVGLEGGSLALSGNEFSAALYVGGGIRQTALVPANAESLDFEAYGVPGPSGFSVTLGGQKLSYSLLYDGPDYIEYGANIPATMQGQMEQLTFLCDPSGSGGVLLDEIQFSSSAAPEPGELALIGLGAGIFYMRKLRERRVSTTDGHSLLH